MRLLPLLGLLGFALGQTTTASAPVATYTVGPSQTYTNVTSAYKALPNDGQSYAIFIQAGVYTEQWNITRLGHVSLVGETSFLNDFTQNLVTIQINNGVLTSASQDETTPVIGVKKSSSDLSGVAFYNLNLRNTFPQTKNSAALATDLNGKNIQAHGCAFYGFQDTFLANKGIQVIANSYIEGSIDFIWGFSTAYFHQCVVASNTPNGCVSAQSRTVNTTSGYVFDTCVLTYTSTYGATLGLSYLGRPYNNYSTAVYMNSYIDAHINLAGWSVWQTTNPQTNHVSFYEYANIGPSSWQADTPRASFVTNLTSDQAVAFTLNNWIGDTTWIDMTAYNLVPSYSLTSHYVVAPVENTTTTTTSASATIVPATSSVSSTQSSSVIFTSPAATTPSTSIAPQPTVSSNSTSTSSIATTTTSAPPTQTNAHPDSGSVPPPGAVIVDGSANTPGAYSNLTSALAALPADATNQTIFIYPGTYHEQVPSINRPGPVRIIGYVTTAPGASYLDNTVVFTFGRGLNVSPVPAGHSNRETATIATDSNTIAFYNVDIVNSLNLDGAVANNVTLAGVIYGSHIGFYAVAFIGWQDTLLTGSRAGYLYYENSYIEGAIDFIWGYSAAYFKSCTIAGKRKGSCMTAQSRLNAAAIGGYWFDQCLFTQAPDAQLQLNGTMYLGRPYSAFATVMIKFSYLDSIINPSGWKIWSATDPRTDNITFVEYANDGPAAWQYNVAARQAFQNATLATSDPFTLAGVMDSTSWIDLTYFNTDVTPQPPTVEPSVASMTTITTVTTAPTSTATSISSSNNATLTITTASSPIGSTTSITSSSSIAPTTTTTLTIFISSTTISTVIISAPAVTSTSVATSVQSLTVIITAGVDDATVTTSTTTTALIIATLQPKPKSTTVRATTEVYITGADATTTLNSQTFVLTATSYKTKIITSTSTIYCIPAGTAAAKRSLLGRYIGRRDLTTSTETDTTLFTTSTTLTSPGSTYNLFTTTTTTSLTTTTQIIAASVITTTRVFTQTSLSTTTQPQVTTTKVIIMTSKVPGSTMTVTPAPVVRTKTVQGGVVTRFTTVTKTARGAGPCSA